VPNNLELNLITRLFEVNGGLSRMCGNTQVRFLETPYLLDTSNKINTFTTLVDNGTITESQANKIILKQIYLQHAEMLKSVL
jgi:hypothetical protein